MSSSFAGLVALLFSLMLFTICSGNLITVITIVDYQNTDCTGTATNNGGEANICQSGGGSSVFASCNSTGFTISVYNADNCPSGSLTQIYSGLLNVCQQNATGLAIGQSFKVTGCSQQNSASRCNSWVSYLHFWN